MSKRITWAARPAMLVGLVVLLAVALAAPAFAAGTPTATATGVVAPLDPAYLRSLVGLPPSVLSAAAGGHGLGLRPAPQQSLTFTAAKGRRLALDAAAPASYDLRTLNRVSSVKDQGTLGTCWAFATCGSLESALLPGESADFSEDNMVLTSGFDVGSDAYNFGGNVDMASAYLTRWGGPVNEAEDKYGDGYTPPNLSPRKHVQEVTFIPARSSASDNTAIKNAIVQYGGAYVSMGWYGSSAGSEYYKVSTSAYYYNGTDGTNHGVLIVGWNDNYAASNFATAPPGNGAFLVKNSWGSSWGAGGYFWASYYDSDFGRLHDLAVFNGSQSPTNYTGLYQYDPLGDCNSYGFSGSSTAWFANVFTAQANASVSAVGFWALAPGSSYEVYTGPSLATKSLATSGTLSTMGFHTVSLPTPAGITGGQQFIVAVKITSAGITTPVAIEAPYSSYSSKATASAGQSFVSADGSAWSDMTSRVANANVCLKAYVSAAAPPSPSAPTVTGFTPTSGAVGTSVTITGTNFTGVTTVAFNGTSATFSVTSATQITATVPTGATTGTLVVTTPNGTGVSTSAFTVPSTPPPTPTPTPTPIGPVVAGFSPTSGAYRTTVVITGTGFTGATKVKFNGVSATFYVTSATQIKASAPYGVTTGPISVTTAQGTGTSSTNFTVGSTTPPPPAVPTVTGISPTSGPVGTSVTITGTNFSPATAVSFNGVSASFSVTSATQITATAPSGGSGTIAVTTPGGTATSVASFTVTAPAVPTVTGFSPTSGPVGTLVTIAGTNFTGASAVRFNGTVATFSVTDATHISATVPAGAATGTVSVTTAAGTATSVASFTVTVAAPGAPVISSFSPTSGRYRTTVVITGIGFTGATKVRFSGVSATFYVVSATQIKVSVPYGVTTGPISVTTPLGTGTSLALFFVL